MRSRRMSQQQPFLPAVAARASTPPANAMQREVALPTFIRAKSSHGCYRHEVATTSLPPRPSTTIGNLTLPPPLRMQSPNVASHAMRPLSIPALCPGSPDRTPWRGKPSSIRRRWPEDISVHSPERSPARLRRAISPCKLREHLHGFSTDGTLANLFRSGGELGAAAFTRAIIAAVPKAGLADAMSLFEEIDREGTGVVSFSQVREEVRSHALRRRLVQRPKAIKYESHPAQAPSVAQAVSLGGAVTFANLSSDGGEEAYKTMRANYWAQLRGIRA